MGRLEREHRERFGTPPTLVVRAPGRVNLLGGHVDYSEGWVLPCAIEPALHLTASPRSDRRLELHLPDLAGSASLDVDRLPPPLPQRTDRADDHGDLTAGVAWALADRGCPLVGASIAVRSTIPIGAGVSSSAAFEVATALALTHLAGHDLPPLEIARVGRSCENEYLGLGSGIMDQVASLLGTPGAALLLDCRSLDHRVVARPDTLRFLIVDSGVRRRLVDSGYGDRAAEVAEATARIRRARPELVTLRDLTPAELAEAISELPPPLDRRVRHVVSECARTLRGAEALGGGDLDALAAILRAAHESLRDDFEVTVPELDAIAEAAWGAPGAFGARAFGGGFGGCVVVPVEEQASTEVAERIARHFRARFGRAPAFLLTDATAGASVTSFRR